MNDPKRPSVSDPVPEALQAAVESAFREVPPGQESPDAGGPSADPGLAARRALVSPELLGSTIERLLRLVDRAAARSLFCEALKASGDKEWAAGIVASWAWSDGELTEVRELVRLTAEMYGAETLLRPDVCLLAASGIHFAGYMTTRAAIRSRAVENRAGLAEQAKAKESPKE